eukprot:scaffold2006_cov283-Chaetoceros_neogracile.AAC.16
MSDRIHIALPACACFSLATCKPRKDRQPVSQFIPGIKVTLSGKEFYFAQTTKTTNFVDFITTTTTTFQ